MAQRRARPDPPATAGLLRVTVPMVAYKLVGNGGVTAVALLTARQLGPSGRGTLVLLLTLASFTLLLCSLGVNTSGRIYLVGPRRAVELSDYLGLSISLAALQMVFCTALSLLLLPVVDVQLTWSERGVLAMFAGTLLYAYLLNGALNAHGSTVAATAVEAGGAVAQLVIVLLLMRLGVETVTPYLLGMTAGNVVQIHLATARLGRLALPMRPRYRPERWRMLVRTGLPGIAMDTAQVLTFRLDRYLIGIFMTPAAVGVYSVAATAPELLRLPTLALSQPIFHRLASGKAKIADFQRTLLLCLGVTGLLSALTFILAPSIVHLAFGPEYAGAVTPLRVLLLAEFGMTVYYLDASSLAGGLARVGDAASAAVVGLVVATLAGLVAIPAHGILGAAWVSVVAYSLTGLVAHLLLKRRLDQNVAVPDTSAGYVQDQA